MNIDAKLERELLVFLAKGKFRQQLCQALDELVDALQPPPPPASPAKTWRRF